MSDDSLRFTEIEHKFVVDEGFDLLAFGTTLDGMSPTRRTSVKVRDRYFLTTGGRSERFLIRHRFDDELHHLTLKTLEEDPEVRGEINLDLGHHAGDQAAAVDAFLERLGVEWRGTLHKDLDVWYFPGVEVVHYRATTDDRALRCVEFEATQKDSLEAARAAVERYEWATGFNDKPRERLSLPQLLFPDVAAALGGTGGTDA